MARRPHRQLSVSGKQKSFTQQQTRATGPATSDAASGAGGVVGRRPVVEGQGRERAVAVGAVGAIEAGGVLRGEVAAVLSQGK